VSISAVLKPTIPLRKTGTVTTDTKMAPPSDSKDHFGKKTNQSWEKANEGFLYTVVDAMLKTRFTEKEIIQITGGNFCRIFDKATTK